MVVIIGRRVLRYNFLFVVCAIFAAGLLLAGCAATDSRGKARGKKPGRASLDKPPTPDERAFLIARSRFGHKHYPDAIKELSHFLKTYPKSQYRGKVLQMLTRIYLKSGDCNKAVPAFKELLEESPEEVTGELRWQMGECYYSMQQYNQALVEYQLVLDRYPKSVQQERLLYKMGLTAYKLNWLNQAQTSLLRVGGYNLKPEEKITLFFTRAQIARKLKDYSTTWQAAMEALRVVEQEPSLAIVRMGEQVREFVIESVLGHLPPEELERIVATYFNKFPAGEALWQLIQFQVKEKNPEETLRLLDIFLKDFSLNHPHYKEAQEMRSRLEEELRVDQNKIGVIVPFSGKLAPFGLKVLHGIELAVEEENRRRKDKKKIALIIKDSKGQANLVEQHMRELIEKERVIAVLGPVLSKAAMAAAHIANELETPMLAPAASAYGIPETGPYVFRNSLTAFQQVQSIAYFATQEMGLRRFAVLAPESSYGQEQSDIFTVMIESDFEGRMLAQLTYAPEDTDFRPQIEYLHTLPIQAIFLPDYYDKIVQIAPQVAFYSPEREEGVLQKLIEHLPARPEEEPLVPVKVLDRQSEPFFLSEHVPSKPGLKLPEDSQEELAIIKDFPTPIFLLGTHGWYNPQLIKDGGKYIERSVFSCGFFAQSKNPLVKDFLKRFKGRFWEEPDLLAAQAYDTANILLEVLRQGARTRPVLRESLEQLEEFAGVTGTGAFDADGDMEKELAVVGVKKRRFRSLNGEEKWLHPFPQLSWGTLFKEDFVEELLSWELYYMLEPLELFDTTQPVAEEEKAPLFN